MRSLPTIYGTVESMFNPPFRKVNFDDEKSMATVAKHLRRAWISIPPEEPSYDAVNRFLRHDAERSSEAQKRVPKNPNRNDTQTAWRQVIYFYWNHLFFDVMNFLPHTQSGVGHFHPPAHGSFAIEYLDFEFGSPPIQKSWKKNMLVMPTFLDTGVSVRFETERGAKEGEPWGLLGVFDDRNPNEVWFIKKDLEVNIYVEGNSEGQRNGVAAVFVYGTLCTDRHENGDPIGGDEFESMAQLKAQWSATEI